MNTQTAIISSPCIGICQLTEDGFCTGCARNLQEINDWLSYTEKDRIRLIEEVLPVRAQQLFDQE